MVILIWALISVICLVSFLFLNRWKCPHGRWATDREAGEVVFFCALWPIGILLFIFLVLRDITERFLP